MLRYSSGTISICNAAISLSIAAIAFARSSQDRKLRPRSINSAPSCATVSSIDARSLGVSSMMHPVAVWGCSLAPAQRQKESTHILARRRSADYNPHGNERTVKSAPMQGKFRNTDGNGRNMPSVVLHRPSRLALQDSQTADAARPASCSNRAKLRSIAAQSWKDPRTIPKGQDPGSHPVLSNHEHASLLNRLKQIHAERKFPGLTDRQADAIERERLTVESTPGLDDMYRKEHGPTAVDEHKRRA
jgi:hypothetical protein